MGTRGAGAPGARRCASASPPSPAANAAVRAAGGEEDDVDGQGVVGTELSLRERTELSLRERREKGKG